MNHLPGSGNHMVDSDVGENKRPPLNSNDIYEEYLIERDMITHKDEKDSTFERDWEIIKEFGDWVKADARRLNFFDVTFGGLAKAAYRKLEYSHQIFWQLLPNRCYVLGGLSALNLI